MRVNDEEYAMFQSKVKESDLTQQAYVISAIMGATVTSSDEIAVLKELSKTFADVERQLRGMATNVNQMAHVANGQRLIPAERELEKISVEIKDYRKECEDIWQSIRSLINGQKVMEQ